MKYKFKGSIFFKDRNNKEQYFTDIYYFDSDSYDMKYDFGLLHWNKYFPFRIQLHYKKYSYYLGCIMNFIFRNLWKLA
jgi:hypothetical protein